jgi:hypothetical protein
MIPFMVLSLLTAMGLPGTFWHSNTMIAALAKAS